MKHIEVAIGVVVRESHVLICRRRQESTLGGYWEFPGGKRELEETIEDCLHRELREELGIEVEIFASWPLIEHNYPDAHVTLHPFRCHWTANEPQAIASEQFLWVVPSSLAEYEFPPANAPLLELIQMELGEPAGEPHREHELDALRIRQVAKGRRALLRIRSYCLVGAIAAAVIAVDLLWRGAWTIFTPTGMLYLISAVAILWLGARLFAKARRLGQEASRQTLPEPISQPDFSNLNNGTQVVKNLEQIR